MNKFEMLNELMWKQNGYLFTAEVEKKGISRTYLAKYVKEHNLEKAAKAIYLSDAP